MDIVLRNLEEIQSTRKARQQHLRNLGIDEAFIGQLVESFYLKVRSDAELGPIFGAEISDWGPHLDKMKLFWQSVVLKENVYSGKPVPAHMKLKGVRSSHFEKWLSLFSETLTELTDSKEIHREFIEPASRIAQRLSSMMNLVD